MTALRLDHVVYDEKARGFRAFATLNTATFDCFWPGPARSDFATITKGLVDTARLQMSA